MRLFSKLSVGFERPALTMQGLNWQNEAASSQQLTSKPPGPKKPNPETHPKHASAPQPVHGHERGNEFCGSMLVTRTWHLRYNTFEEPCETSLSMTAAEQKTAIQTQMKPLCCSEICRTTTLLIASKAHPPLLQHLHKFADQARHSRSGWISAQSASTPVRSCLVFGLRAWASIGSSGFCGLFQA